jgi:iron-sulfur cluster assembly protein
MANEPSTQQTTPDAAGVATGKVATIEVSLKAIEAIKKQIATRHVRLASEAGGGTPETALRVGVRGGGCSGFSYVIEFHDGPPRARDRVLDYKAQDGTPVRVVVDPKSLLYLNGATLDWEQTLMQQGFKFLNPHEKTSCGCGHSFTV